MSNQRGCARREGQKVAAFVCTWNQQLTDDFLESADAATREVAKVSLACIAPDRKTTQTIQKLSHQDKLR